LFRIDLPATRLPDSRVLAFRRRGTTISAETPESGSADAIKDQKVAAWVETHIGGTV
jgi:hypothetical protein